jgi:plastocyanin
MRQELTTDTVERYIDAPPEAIYAIVADITRTPELSPDIVRCEWLDGATGPVVGARFKAINHQGRGPDWSNKPVIVTVEPGREIAWARTEPFAGTVEWRYRFIPEGTGTRVVESYTVTKQLTIVGWFVIGTLYGMKDRRRDLRATMVATLDRLAEMTEVRTDAGRVGAGE